MVNKKAIGGIVAATVAIISIVLLKRKQKAEPALPPGEGVPTGLLTGTVTDAETNEPLIGVLIQSAYQQTITGSNGNYAMNATQALHELEFSKEGYTSQVKQVAIGSSGATVNVALTLYEEYVPPEGGPELPTPGTGVPTDEEVNAVKAVVRYRLEHLGFNVCADQHFTDQMNQATTLAMAPIASLQARYQTEIDRILALILTDPDYLGALAEVKRLQQLFTTVNAEYTRTGDINMATWSPAIRALAIEWQFAYYWMAGPGTYFQSNKLTYTIMAAGNSAGLVAQRYQDMVRPLRIARDSLGIMVWYCGYPL